MVTMREYINTNGSVIISHAKERPVGHVFEAGLCGNLNGSSEEVHQPFVIVRVATELEYRKQMKQAGFPIRCGLNPYFYEVRTD